MGENKLFDSRQPGREPGKARLKSNTVACVDWEKVWEGLCDWRLGMEKKIVEASKNGKVMGKNKVL